MLAGQWGGGSEIEPRGVDAAPAAAAYVGGRMNSHPSFTGVDASPSERLPGA